jgi:hypothetical protein
MGALGQGLPRRPDFTREELLSVTEFFLAPDKARHAVDSLLAEQSSPTDGSTGELRRDRSVTGITFSRDMLILLSFLSPETHAKVAEYRRRVVALSQTPSEEDASWASRSNELRNVPEVRKWVKERRK